MAFEHGKFHWTVWFTVRFLFSWQASISEPRSPQKPPHAPCVTSTLLCLWFPKFLHLCLPPFLPYFFYHPADLLLSWRWDWNVFKKTLSRTPGPPSAEDRVGTEGEGLGLQRMILWTIGKPGSSGHYHCAKVSARHKSEQLCACAMQSLPSDLKQGPFAAWSQSSNPIHTVEVFVCQHLFCIFLPRSAVKRLTFNKKQENLSIAVPPSAFLTNRITIWHDFYKAEVWLHIINASIPCCIPPHFCFFGRPNSTMVCSPYWDQRWCCNSEGQL